MVGGLALKARHLLGEWHDLWRKHHFAGSLLTKLFKVGSMMSFLSVTKPSQKVGISPGLTEGLAGGLKGGLNVGFDGGF